MKTFFYAIAIITFSGLLMDTHVSSKYPSKDLTVITRQNKFLEIKIDNYLSKIHNELEKDSINNSKYFE